MLAVTRRAKSLINVVGTRIVVFALLAAAADGLLTIRHHVVHTDMVGRLVVEHEAEALGQGLRMSDGDRVYDLPLAMSRYRDANSGYLARVRTLDGATLFVSCSSECDGAFPQVQDARTTFWLGGPSPDSSFRLVGGKITEHGPQPLQVDLAILGDTEGVARRVLRNALLDDLVIPVGATVLIFLAVIMPIRRALWPVTEAGDRILRLGPAAADSISTRDLPREVALLIHAVRDAFAKQTEAMRSQKIFAAAISHEVRTPLTIARLELENIADPRARRVEADLEALNRLVEQLTALARLETTPDAPSAVDLAALAGDVVGALAPLAFGKGKKLALQTEGSGSVQGHPTLIENALRNLVENAIRHAGPGAAIQVVVGPGAQLAVIDDGGSDRACGGAGLLDENAADRPGLGLRIVRRIAELHGGQLEIRPQPAGGVLARLWLGAGHETRH